MKPSLFNANKMLYWLIAISVIAISIGIYRSQQQAAAPSPVLPARPYYTRSSRILR